MEQDNSFTDLTKGRQGKTTKEQDNSFTDLT